MAKLLLLQQRPLRHCQRCPVLGVTSYIRDGKHAYIAGRAVSESGENSEELVVFETKPQLYAFVEHHGNPELMGITISSLLDWVKNSEFELDESYNNEYI